MSKERRKFELLARLQALGFTYAEACQLRRIEMTLHRWAELECGDSNDFYSWSLARGHKKGGDFVYDEENGKPYIERHSNRPNSEGKYPVYYTLTPDRERGALRRLDAIVKARNLRSDAHVIPYHQTDPRGCALYILQASDLIADASIDSIYTRGLAVAA